MSKKLVAYFSATGVTARLAKRLAEAVGADLFEIKPQIPYTDADLSWNDKGSRSSVEMSDLSFRPPIADHSGCIQQYDVVFVGFPIWWYIAPTIVNTFLEDYDFSGKIIVPFATSGGSGLGQTVEKLRPSTSDQAVWNDGRVLRGNTLKEELVNWVDRLHLPS